LGRENVPTDQCFEVNHCIALKLKKIDNTFVSMFVRYRKSLAQKFIICTLTQKKIKKLTLSGLVTKQRTELV